MATEKEERLAVLEKAKKEFEAVLVHKLPMGFCRRRAISLLSDCYSSALYAINHPEE